MPDIDLDPFEIVATGNLYKRHLVRSAWSERKVILCGQYLYQFTRSDVYRGRFLVANCTVTIIDPDTDIVPPGFFGFILKGLGRDITFCVATKKELISWITVIHDQVAEFEDGLRQHLKRGEVVIGSQFVRVLKSPLTYDSAETWCDGSVSVRLIVTTFPRFFFVDLPSEENYARNEIGSGCCVPTFGLQDVALDSLFSSFRSGSSAERPIDDSWEFRKKAVQTISKEQKTWDNSSHPSVKVLSSDSIEVCFANTQFEDLRLESNRSSRATTVSCQSSSNDVLETYIKFNTYVFIDEINGSKYWCNVFSDLTRTRLLTTDRKSQSAVIKKEVRRHPSRLGFPSKDIDVRVERMRSGEGIDEHKEEKGDKFTAIDGSARYTVTEFTVPESLLAANGSANADEEDSIEVYTTPSATEEDLGSIDSKDENGDSSSSTTRQTVTIDAVLDRATSTREQPKVKSAPNTEGPRFGSVTGDILDFPRAVQVEVEEDLEVSKASSDPAVSDKSSLSLKDRRDSRSDTSPIDLTIRQKVDPKFGLRFPESLAAQKSEKGIFVRNWNDDNYKLISSGMVVDSECPSSLNPLGRSVPRLDKDKIGTETGMGGGSEVGSELSLTPRTDRTDRADKEKFVRNWDNDNYNKCGNGIITALEWGSSSSRGSRSRSSSRGVSPIPSCDSRRSNSIPEDSDLNKVGRKGEVFLKNFDDDAYRKCGSGIFEEAETKPSNYYQLPGGEDGYRGNLIGGRDGAGGGGRRGSRRFSALLIPSSGSSSLTNSASPSPVHAAVQFPNTFSSKALFTSQLVKSQSRRTSAIVEKDSLTNQSTSDSNPDSTSHALPKSKSGSRKSSGAQSSSTTRKRETVTLRHIETGGSDSDSKSHDSSLSIRKARSGLRKTFNDEIPNRSSMDADMLAKWKLTRASMKGVNDVIPDRSSIDAILTAKWKLDRLVPRPKADSSRPHMKSLASCEEFCGDENEEENSLDRLRKDYEEEEEEGGDEERDREDGKGKGNGNGVRPHHESDGVEVEVVVDGGHGGADEDVNEKCRAGETSQYIVVKGPTLDRVDIGAGAGAEEHHNGDAQYVTVAGVGSGEGDGMCNRNEEHVSDFDYEIIHGPSINVNIQKGHADCEEEEGLQGVRERERGKEGMTLKVEENREAKVQVADGTAADTAAAAKVTGRHMINTDIDPSVSDSSTASPTSPASGRPSIIGSFLRKMIPGKKKASPG